MGRKQASRSRYITHTKLRREVAGTCTCCTVWYATCRPLTHTHHHKHHHPPPTMSTSICSTCSCSLAASLASVTSPARTPFTTCSWKAVHGRGWCIMVSAEGHTCLELHLGCYLWAGCCHVLPAANTAVLWHSRVPAPAHDPAPAAAAWLQAGQRGRSATCSAATASSTACASTSPAASLPQACPHSSAETPHSAACRWPYPSTCIPVLALLCHRLQHSKQRSRHVGDVSACGQRAGRQDYSVQGRGTTTGRWAEQAEASLLPISSNSPFLICALGEVLLALPLLPCRLLPRNLRLELMGAGDESRGRVKGGTALWKSSVGRQGKLNWHTMQPAGAC